MNIKLDNIVCQDDDFLLYEGNEIIVIKSVGQNLFYIGLKHDSFIYENIQSYDYCMIYSKKDRDIVEIDVVGWKDELDDDWFLGSEIGYDETKNEILLSARLLIDYEEYFLKEMNGY